jgi:hypothetical protein
MKKRLWFFLSVVAIWSCSEKEKPAGYFDRNDFKDSTALSGEVIDFAPLNDAAFYDVVRDSLLFICTFKGDPYYIEVYNLNTHQKLAQIAPRGNGPGEFLGCYFRYDTNLDDYFSLYDVVAKRAAVYSIDSVLARGMKYIPRQVQLPDGTLNIATLASDTLLGYNFYHFNNGEIVNKADCLLKIAVNDDSASKINCRGEGDLFTANVSWAGIFPSPETDQIWVADYYKDKIDIYDRNLKLIKSMVGPDLIEPEYTIKNDIHVSFKKKLYQGYYDGFYAKNSIYLLYHGLNGIPGNESYRKIEEVFQISWKGELLHRYKLDRYVYSITLSQDEKYLYGTSDDNPTQMPQLVRYKLK